MIEAHGLRRQFGAVVAVDDLSLSVPDGTILALLGPNGAGKTTTVRLLAGLLAPSAGQATVAGCDVLTNPGGVRSRVGLVTDSPGLHDQMAPAGYLDFFGQVYGLDSTARTRRIDELLHLFELDKVARVPMAGFSRGMQQKVALARALLHQPSVVFLDEPTAGLDPLSARTVRELILRLKDASRSIVLCTHDLAEADRLADRVAILAHGRIVASDSPTALRASASQETLVQVLLASPCPAALTIAQALSAASHASLATTAQGALLSYRTTEAQHTNPQIVRALVNAGAAVISVTCTTATLEDVYASAVGNASSHLAGALA